MHGEFFWYDLMSTDVAAATKFYSDVVGWSVQDAGGSDMDYKLFTVNGQGVAGLMTLPEDTRKMGMPPCWRGYIAVDDVDAAAENLQKAGGSVLRPPTDVPGIIRFAVVADPQGARFLIAKGMSTEAPPKLAPNTPGTIGWRELLAGEWTAAFAFYEKLFGWTKSDAVDMGAMGVYQLFKTGGEEAAGGMMTKPEVVPMPSWGFYFNVESIDAAGGRVTNGGGQIINGPMQVPGGQWIVQCFDPQGAYFSLVANQR